MTPILPRKLLFEADAGFRYSQVKNTSQGHYNRLPDLIAIVNANDPIFDWASNQDIGTTVPYNPFGDYRVTIASNFTTVNFATVHPKDIDTSSLGTMLGPRLNRVTL